MSPYKANKKKVMKLEINNLEKIKIIILGSFHSEISLELLKEQPAEKNYGG